MLNEHHLRASKYELFSCGAGDVGFLLDFEHLMPGVQRRRAPFFPKGVIAALKDKRLALVRAQEHLGNLSAHFSLVLLQNSLTHDVYFENISYLVVRGQRLDDTLK